MTSNIETLDVIAATLLPPRAAPVAKGVIDVSRSSAPWRWTSAITAPLEVLALVWSVPLAMLLVAVPVALTAALLLWLVRFAAGQF